MGCRMFFISLFVFAFNGEILAQVPDSFGVDEFAKNIIGAWTLQKKEIVKKKKTIEITRVNGYFSVEPTSNPGYYTCTMKPDGGTLILWTTSFSLVSQTLQRLTGAGQIQRIDVLNDSEIVYLARSDDGVTLILYYWKKELEKSR